MQSHIYLREYPSHQPDHQHYLEQKIENPSRQSITNYEYLLMNIPKQLSCIHPFKLLVCWAYEAQLRLVAIIFTPNDRNRNARSIPMFPKPKMNTYMIEEF